MSRISVVILACCCIAFVKSEGSVARAAAAAVAAPSATATAPASHMPIQLTPQQIKWAPAPPSLPPGAQLAVLDGDLSRHEPHTMRLKMPDGYSIGPHMHPLDEHITVLRGTVMMGLGRQFDRSKAMSMPAGSYFMLPKGDAHYVWMQGETVVELHGIGPWAITYVNPADDPRQSRAAAKSHG